MNSAAFYQLHRMGTVQLAPSGVKEDPGNKSYLLAMRLCFPKPTAESGIKDAEKLGNVMESMYGYAEMFGREDREDHFFFCCSRRSCDADASENYHLFFRAHTLSSRMCSSGRILRAWSGPEQRHGQQSLQAELQNGHAPEWVHCTLE